MVLLLREIYRSRTRLRLLRQEQIGALLRYVCSPPQFSDHGLVAIVAAECLVRAWLGRRPLTWPVGMIPDVVMPQWLDELLRNWLKGNQSIRQMMHGIPIPDRQEPGSALLTHLDLCLSTWREANGFLPLVLREAGTDFGQEAIAVPFVLSARHRRDDPFVVTTDGSRQEVPGLRQAWDEAWQIAFRAGWVSDGDLLQVRLLGLTPAVADLPEGTSATLPFLLAIYFHQQGMSLGAFDWAASGSFDDSTEMSVLGSGRDAEWRAKLSLIKEFGIPEDRCLLPDGSWKQEIVMPESRIREFTSRFKQSGVQPSVNEVAMELSGIASAMQHGRPDYQVLAAKLDRLLRITREATGLRWDGPRGAAIKLRADLFCHDGMPDLTLELLRDLPPSGCKEGGEARVSIAVALTDLCYYDQCEDLATEALETNNALIHLDGGHELRMKALGTRGQGRMIHALESNERILIESAYEDLKAAAAIAVDLDKETGPGNRSEARNQTYLLLWHAFFEPRNAGPTYQRALELANASAHGPGFVHRTAHLARYRALIMGIDFQFPWWPSDDPPIPATDIAGGYPAATALKYRGAWLASSGSYDLAARDFADASEILGKSNSWLLAFIHGTILLQAGESLLEADANLSKRNLYEAAEIFKEVAALSLINPNSPAAPKQWLRRTRNVLEGSKDSSNDPQKFYPY
jgi:hypothetical protein